MNNHHYSVSRVKTPGRRIIPIFIPHLGCTHECVFCNQNRISGETVPAAPEDVRRIFSDAVKDTNNEEIKSHPIEIAFYGGSFTALPVKQQDDLLSEAHKLLAQYPYGAVRLSTRPDCIDLQMVLRLKDYGVKTIEIGAQSMCDEVLKLSNRGHSSLDVINASQIIKSAGIFLILQMMTGLPGDTFEKSISTARQIAALEPDGVRIYPAVIVSETNLHEMYRNGDYAEHTVKDAVKLCAELVPIFEDARIPIIRMGLNPTDELSGGDVIAGAYHPSFGELVYSRIMYNRAAELLIDVPVGSDIEIRVPKGMTSKMTGQRRCNIEALKAKYSIRSVKITEKDDLQGLQGIECVVKTT